MGSHSAHTMNPLVSVLIDTYNHERYIEQALVSAAEQDFPANDFEILVVDDGSTDRTPEIVRKFAPRVRLLQKNNGGQASAFNAALPELRGDIVALLDGDDWFARGKIAAVAKAFEDHPEAAAVSHGYFEFYETTQEAKPRVPDQPQFLSMTTPDDAAHAAAHWSFLVIGALTVRRTVLQQVFPISESLVFCADAPIAWASMAMGTFVLKNALSYYRHHDTNLHAIGQANRERARRRAEMNERMFQDIEPLLIRMGVSRDAMLASFYPEWVLVSRPRLHDFGGSRMETLRTELRSFRSQYRNPSLGYRLFKYIIFGAAAVLPPRQFYTIWNWYGRRKIARFPDSLRSSRERA